ncbi:MAG TPA: response regulator [Urbifossiella sp.]|nr:response regulator [Urbifossiella sp.]
MGRRVLIADGFADAADSLAELLRLFGHDAEVARTGPDAVARAAAHCPDAAFVSLALPELDGYGVARELVTRGCRPRLLVALTGRGSDTDRAAVAAAGFDRHVLKPADPLDLVRLVTDLG